MKRNFHRPSPAAGDNTLSWLMVFLAASLFTSPWISGYRGDVPAQWNAWVVGFLLACTAFAELFEISAREERAIAVLGVWLAAAPWIIGFGADLKAVAVQVSIGVLAILVSGMELWQARSSRPPHGQ